MKKILPKLKTINFQLKTTRGMTYIELIVVLGIFAVMSSIAMFNYGNFQAKIEIRNLANDIALKIVQAQKDATSGRLPPQFMGSDWKPSFGVYFSDSTDATFDVYNAKFAYFADAGISPIDKDYLCTGTRCDSSLNSDEWLESIQMHKGKIENLEISPSGCGLAPNDISIVFTRPSSSAVFNSKGTDLTGCKTEYVKINIISENKSAQASISVYPSGRIQIN